MTDAFDAQTRQEPRRCPVGVDMLDPDLLVDPFGGYGRLREDDALTRGRFIDGTEAWFVTRFEDVRTVLRDKRFVNTPVLPHIDPQLGTVDARVMQLDQLRIPRDLQKYLLGGILDSDPPDHTRLRKLVLAAFTARRVVELRPRIRGTAERLVSALTEEAGDGAVDLISSLTYPLSIAVVCDLVGIPEQDHAQWHEWGSDLVSMRTEALQHSFPAMIDYIHALVAQRRSALDPDLLSALIRCQLDDGSLLSDVELVSMVLTLVIAGHETTTHLIGNSVVALLTHPEQLAVLLADLSLMPRAVQELVRWCGSVHVTRLRYASEDITLRGTDIRKGDAVLMVLVAANFDPSHYADPGVLDITRQSASQGEDHVGFGHGIHYCLGATLARQECEVALGTLFGRHPRLALAVPAAELDRMRLPGSWRLNSLPVHLDA